MKENKKINKGEMVKCLVQTYQKMAKELKGFLKPFGITLQQYNVLKILKRAKNPLSTSLIRKRMLEPMADTSRLVEKLFIKGLVDRSTCVKDKRLVDVTISSKGIAFLDNLGNLDSVMDKFYQKITQDEIAKLNFLLNKLRG